MNWKPHTDKPTGNETFAALFAIRADDGDLVLLDGLRQWLPESGRWIVEATDEDVTESTFWWLAESELLAPLEALNEPPPDNLKPIYYWLDGYWITDKEEADLMDEINAFGSTHGTAYFPADADPALIDTEIKALLAGEGKS